MKVEVTEEEKGPLPSSCTAFSSSDTSDSSSDITMSDMEDGLSPPPPSPKSNYGFYLDTSG